MKNILILGSSYAGISTAHRILKQSSKTGPVKITLVSPNTHFYWTMASSRGLIPGQFSDDQMFQPISAGFKQYVEAQFEFILASAESLDVDNKSVGISGGRTLKYDFLILATGSHYKGDTPLKGLGSTEATQTALHDFQAQIQKAQKIVVAGGGVTGIEVAGEIAYEYGSKKEVILIASNPTLLHESPPFISKFATKELHNLNVTLKLGTKITSHTHSTPDNKHHLLLSNNEKLVADLYIPTFGLLPNSSYIPSNFLNENGYLVVDDFLAVKGAKDVWAIGDVSAVEPSQFIYADKQSGFLAKNLGLLLSGKPVLKYKVATSRIFGFQVGKKAGTAHYGNWVQMPGFVIVRVRKNLFLEKFVGLLDGSGL
ncbi:nucleotide-binding domain-containing protein [Mollisia scopiformis]|uniref:Nucleotide-binding domain-containing protein n=1 Tax=Mollisia scopiformis TaxID=149040 RepID=A0A132B3G2_MOLSC|nr:nucleotide-binding domain-containing protein [Mollisia scopiformis]KUJ06579.1 nucleotide-binding domain-containing protein [Mollisia scopiformis]